MPQSSVSYGVSYRGRFILVLTLMLLGLGAVWGKAYYNHFIKVTYYADKSRLYMQQERIHLAPRADIIDRNGNPIAISNIRSVVVVEPKNFLDNLQKRAEQEYKKCKEHYDKKSAFKEDCEWMLPERGQESQKQKDAIFAQYKALRIEQFVGALHEHHIHTISFEDFQKELKRIAQQSGANNHWRLNRHVSVEQASALLKLGFVGVHKEDIFERYYPQRELFMQVVGYTEKMDSLPSIKQTLKNNETYFTEGKGIAGLELQYNERLRSASGLSAIYRGKGERAIAGIVHEARHVDYGQDLVLSMDSRIQNVVHQALNSAYRKSGAGAKEMMAVVIDVDTSEILAMQSLPVGNPNQYSARTPNLTRNRLIADAYEMGSIQKPIAMLPAIELGKMNANTHFPFPKNCVRYYGKAKITDTGRCLGRSMSATSIIARSSNVGMSYVSDLLPSEVFVGFMKKLGLGQTTDLKFIGESAGLLKLPDNKNKHGYAVMHFGYGLRSTPLQMANAYTIIANGGIKRPLSLLKKTQVEEGERVIKESTARTMRQMLYATVNSDEGTAKGALTASYTTAGKTGTAKKLLSKKVGNREIRFYGDKYLASFVGYAPAGKPKIVVAVLVDEPLGKAYYGGAVAAPIFAEIVENSLPLLGVVSDKLEKDKVIRVGREEAVPALLRAPAAPTNAKSAAKPAQKTAPKSAAKPAKPTQSPTQKSKPKP